MGTGPDDPTTAHGDVVARKRHVDALAAQIAALGGGAGGSVRELTFAFAYNDAGLNAGIVAYTPTIGDSLLNAWVQVPTAWDGTTPFCDVGTFVGAATGIYGLMGFTLDLSHPDESLPGTGLVGNDSMFAASTANARADALAPSAVRVVPAPFDGDPIKVCVSQDGTAGGADPGASQGAAVLHLLISTPTASPG